jgi:hypothetical protein
MESIPLSLDWVQNNLNLVLTFAVLGLALLTLLIAVFRLRSSNRYYKGGMTELRQKASEAGTLVASLQTAHEDYRNKAQAKINGQQEEIRQLKLNYYELSKKCDLNELTIQELRQTEQELVRTVANLGKSVERLDWAAKISESLQGLKQNIFRPVERDTMQQMRIWSKLLIESASKLQGRHDLATIMGQAEMLMTKDLIPKCQDPFTQMVMAWTLKRSDVFVSPELQNYISFLYRKHQETFPGTTSLDGIIDQEDFGVYAGCTTSIALGSMTIKGVEGFVRDYPTLTQELWEESNQYVDRSKFN